ncbi:hypothetical protein LFM09_45730 [Lentzea alba]|uniref:hypothetical protein n=1 Tax=Lentzea alba TaxID=2714351 RepID=UPI0039BEF65A
MKFKGMLRRVAGVGVAVAAVGSMLIAPASAAPAAQDEVSAAAEVNILHASTRVCLAGNDKYEVGLECNGTAHERWVNFTSKGVGRFRNVEYNACLASDGLKVFLMDRCDTPSSGWTSLPGSPKLLRHAVETTKCLHTNAGTPGRWAYLIDCDQATRWSVLPAA